MACGSTSAKMAPALAYPISAGSGGQSGVAVAMELVRGVA